MKICIDTRDWWVGWYRGPHHHYACPLPCIVIRWPRQRKPASKPSANNEQETAT